MLKMNTEDIFSNYTFFKKLNIFIFKNLKINYIFYKIFLILIKNLHNYNMSYQIKAIDSSGILFTNFDKCGPCVGIRGGAQLNRL